MNDFLQKLRSSAAARPLFSGVMLIFAVFFVQCVLFGGLHLAACVLFLAFGAFTGVCFWRRGACELPFSAVCGALAAVGSLTFLLNGNGLIGGFLFFFLMVLYTSWAAAFAPRVCENRGSWRYLAALVRLGVCQPLALWPEAWRMLLTPFRRAKGRRMSDVLIGLLIAVPVCVVAVVLLAMGDSAFSGLLSAAWQRIASFDLTVPWKIVLIVLIWPLFTGFVLGVRRAPKSRAAVPPPAYRSGKVHRSSSIRFLSPTVSVTVLTALSAVYVMYLFSQLSYFFSAFASLLPEDYTFTYAEYARRGFFEMCLLTLVNFSLLCAALLFTRRTGKRVSPALKAVSCVVCAFTLLFIATSLSKILLYVSSYGLTTLRLYTAVFDGMLLICVVCLGAHLFWPKWKYMRVILVSVSAVFIVFALVDADRIIAAYNTSRYLNDTTQATEIDVDYLSTLDSAAVPYLEKIYLARDTRADRFSGLRDGNAALRAMADWSDKLCTVRTQNGRAVGYDYKYQTSPTKFCLSDRLAVQVLDRHFEAIEQWKHGTVWNETAQSAADAQPANEGVYVDPTNEMRMHNL